MPLQHFFIVLEHVLRHGLRPKKVHGPFCVVVSPLYRSVFTYSECPSGLIFYIFSRLAFQGLLGPKKELWDILQLVEKYASEAQDITSSVRDLPTVRFVLLSSWNR